MEAQGSRKSQEKESGYFFHLELLSQTGVRDKKPSGAGEGLLRLPQTPRRARRKTHKAHRRTRETNIFIYCCEFRTPISKSFACKSTTDRSHIIPQHLIEVQRDLRTNCRIIPRHAPPAAIPPLININCSDPLRLSVSEELMFYKVSTENKVLYARSYRASSGFFGLTMGWFFALGRRTSISESDELSSCTTTTRFFFLGGFFL